MSSSPPSSLDVQWRSTASFRSSALMPAPSSVTRISAAPPAAIVTSIRLRAGVDGVFGEFLDHARRPLDHLAGGDAVDHVFGEAADGHGAIFVDSRGGGKAGVSAAHTCGG